MCGVTDAAAFAEHPLAARRIAWCVERRGVARPVRRPQPRPPQRPVAPDDDEDFLRDLDRKRRHPEDPDGG